MNTLDTKSLATILTPRQSAFMQAYTDPSSPSFSNCYQSAIAAGYSDKTARNLIHLQPDWLSDSIGHMAAVQPEELMQVLTEVIHSDTEPTIIRLRAVELAMRAHNMLVQRQESTSKTVTLNLDLSGNAGSMPPSSA